MASPRDSSDAKSGSNDLHGSANYFFQNDGLQSSNQNFEDEAFSTYDTAVTLGGPILRDKPWFFGSYRRVGEDTDVATLDTGEIMRTVNRTANESYARISVAPTANDTLVLTYLVGIRRHQRLHRAGAVRERPVWEPGRVLRRLGHRP